MPPLRMVLTLLPQLDAHLGDQNEGKMRIFVAGHGGMVGQALLRALEARGHDEVITTPRAALDLRDMAALRRFLAKTRPEAVILAAARVGGIWANQSYPVAFLQDNMRIAFNVIEGAHEAGITRLLNLGSSCIYPRDAPQPLAEAALLSGPLEPTNEPYAIAKIAAIKLCESYNRQYGTDFRSLMPANLYGRGDNFHPQEAHVLPALLARFHDAARSGKPFVRVWGTGQARREFLHVDDLAQACLFALDLPPATYSSMTEPQRSILNIGRGQDVSIADLAVIIAQITGFKGRIEFDPSKPDGTARKCLDVTRMSSLGWQAQVGLEEGIAQTYDWFLRQSRGGLRGLPLPLSA